MAAAAAGRAAAFLRGLQRYRHYPWRREALVADDKEVIGDMALHRYGQAGAPIILIPSLINRAYILDFLPDHSFARYLAAQGCVVYLLDWQDYPSRADGLDAVIVQLRHMLQMVAKRHSHAVSAFGYCMGGSLLLGALADPAISLHRAIFCASPYDFSAMPPLPALLANNLGRLPQPPISLDWLQYYFYSLDPLAGYRKFSHFAALQEDDPKLLDFIALEDWLNDGVPLAARVASDCHADWFKGNKLAKGEWVAAGHLVQPQLLRVPSLHVLPQRDQIVPPAAAARLAELMPIAALLSPEAGHIGLMVSRRSAPAIWHNIADWLLD